THTQQLQNGAYVESKVGQPPQHGKIRNTVGGAIRLLSNQQKKERKQIRTAPPSPRREASRARGEEPSEFPPTNQTQNTNTTQTENPKKASSDGRRSCVCGTRHARTHTHTRSGPSECLLFSL